MSDPISGPFVPGHKPIPPVQSVPTSSAVDPASAGRAKIDQRAQARKLVAQMRAEAARYRGLADRSTDAEFAAAQRAVADEIDHQADLYLRHLNRADASPPPSAQGTAGSTLGNPGALGERHNEVPKGVSPHLVKAARYRQMADDALSSSSSAHWREVARAELAKALPKLTARLDKAPYGGSSGRAAAIENCRRIEQDMSAPSGVRQAYRELRRTLEES